MQLSNRNLLGELIEATVSLLVGILSRGSSLVMHYVGRNINT